MKIYRLSVKVTDKLYYTLSDCMGNGLPLMRNELTKQFVLIGTDGTNAFEIRKSIVCIFSLIILLSLIVLCLGVKWHSLFPPFQLHGKPTQYIVQLFQKCHGQIVYASTEKQQY